MTMELDSMFHVEQLGLEESDRLKLACGSRD